MKKKLRSKAREYAVQALYQWQLSQTSLDELLLYFEQDHSFLNVDKGYWRELVTQTLGSLSEIDRKMNQFLTRSIKGINPVELAILRLSFYELCSRPEIPYRVVINEALELVKLYGATEGYRFVNGVLDAAAGELRALEVASKKTESS